MRRGDAHIVVCRTEQRSITGDRDTGYRHLLLGNQLMGACILGQVPEPDAPCSIAADDLALVGMDYHIVGG